MRRPATLLLAASALALAGCATWRADAPRPESRSWERPQDTALGRHFAAAEALHPGLSAAVLLGDSAQALDAHLALADAAERSIDLQYYIYRADGSGLRLLERLVAAADRGVRVRILVDDVNLDATDFDLAALDLHPLIEIRVFNPFAWRPRWSRSLQGLTDFDRLNRRLHNKMFAVDGQVVMLGGRNIGDEYSGLHPEANFSDLEVALSGPGARDVARGFDPFWNDTLSVPAAALPSRAPGDADLQRVRAGLRQRLAALETARPRDPVAERAALAPLLATAQDAGAWSRTHYLQDPPGKARRGARLDSPLVLQLQTLMEQAQREILVESSYLVPGRALREQLGTLAARGVAVRVLTNSLAATDVAMVHSGYARHRRGLLAMGVALHEFRPFRLDASGAGPPGSSRASLHSKALVVDRRRVWIGSFNLDPRSIRLNTENGVLIDNPRLADELAARVLDDTSPAKSWKLEFAAGCADTRRCPLRWRGTVDGVERVLDREPEASLARRAMVRFMRLLPPADTFL